MTALKLHDGLITLKLPRTLILESEQGTSDADASEDGAAEVDSDISDMFGDEEEEDGAGIVPTEHVVETRTEYHSIDVMLRLSGWNNAV